MGTLCGSCSRQSFQLLPLPSSQLPAPSSSLQIISPLCCHNCSHPPGSHLLTTRCTITSPTATMPYDVEEEVGLLIGHIKRLSTDGESVTFKALFDDDEVANSLESLAGTLKAAKIKGKVHYGPELLLQGMSDSVVISLTGK